MGSPSSLFGRAPGLSVIRDRNGLREQVGSRDWTGIVMA